jgi:hypothetical protein
VVPDGPGGSGDQSRVRLLNLMQERIAESAAVHQLSTKILRKAQNLRDEIWSPGRRRSTPQQTAVITNEVLYQLSYAGVGPF